MTAVSPASLEDLAWKPIRTRRRPRVFTKLTSALLLLTSMPWLLLVAFVVRDAVTRDSEEAKDATFEALECVARLPHVHACSLSYGLRLNALDGPDGPQWNERVERELADGGLPSHCVASIDEALSRRATVHADHREVDEELYRMKFLLEERRGRADELSPTEQRAFIARLKQMWRVVMGGLLEP